MLSPVRDICTSALAADQSHEARPYYTSATTANTHRWPTWPARLARCYILPSTVVQKAVCVSSSFIQEGPKCQLGRVLHLTAHPITADFLRSRLIPRTKLAQIREKPTNDEAWSRGSVVRDDVPVLHRDPSVPSSVTVPWPVMSRGGFIKGTFLSLCSVDGIEVLWAWHIGKTSHRQR